MKPREKIAAGGTGKSLARRKRLDRDEGFAFGHDFVVRVAHLFFVHHEHVFIGTGLERDAALPFFVLFHHHIFFPIVEITDDENRFCIGTRK